MTEPGGAVGRARPARIGGGRVHRCDIEEILVSLRRWGSVAGEPFLTLRASVGRSSYEGNTLDELSEALDDGSQNNTWLKVDKLELCVHGGRRSAELTVGRAGSGLRVWTPAGLSQSTVRREVFEVLHRAGARRYKWRLPTRVRLTDPPARGPRQGLVNAIMVLSTVLACAAGILTAILALTE
jgi:hypothetical protein